ncbi:PucR family transcriptional regulator ligand-binding domain-containing protein [Leucobacter insecticola]|uniref:PucR family transcriptional regulator ligand-binding domain-containing protein n=1 Tax=Leucobacter insecticola TaxID=2714934 RepID=UPI001FCBFFAF|nr:PucR family transcriptional regulator ligand-binding domain-containing protein [Leucobacter insecticola]
MTQGVSGSSYPTIELGDLLHQYALSLVVIAGAGDDTDSRLVRWVHSSELEDPTPFLPPRTVLLTTGARFSDIADQRTADAYVQRLIAADTTALGVAVGVHWDRVPATFVSACDRLGLPLFRVPYDTAFIAVTQAAARLLDARIRERDIWALESQRAVTNASLHRNGLGAAIREASSRLGGWVGITDRSGRLVEFAPQSARARVSAEWIRRETRRLIERGASAGRIGTGMDSEGSGLQMHTLGRAGRVLGSSCLRITAPPTMPNAHSWVWWPPSRRCSLSTAAGWMQRLQRCEPRSCRRCSRRITSLQPSWRLGCSPGFPGIRSSQSDSRPIVLRSVPLRKISNRSMLAAPA